MSDVNKMIADVVDEEVAKQLSNIPKTVEDMITNSIGEIIGLKKYNNGTYKVNTDSYSKSAVCNYIAKVVDESIDSMIGPIVKDRIGRAIKTKSFIINLSETVDSAICREFRRKFEYLLSDTMAKLAAESVADICKKLADGTVSLKNVNADINDPNCFKGAIGHVLLERIAIDIADEKANGIDDE